MEYNVYRFELWGNEKDGFECNNQFMIGSIELMHNEGDKAALRMVRDLLDGYSYAFTENKSGFMKAKNASDWGFNWSDENYADITYRGTPVGSLEATNEK